MSEMLEGKDSYPWDDKIRILVWGDSPATATGFAQVVRGIFTPLGKSGRYDIDIIGINDRGGWKNPEKYPFRIYPAAPSTQVEGVDYHGRPRLISTLLGKDVDVRHIPWDIVFLLNDPFILEAPIPVFNRGTLQVLKDIQRNFDEALPPQYRFKIVYYVPIDSPVKGNWVKDSIALADTPIAYTTYCKEEVAKADKALTEPTHVADNMDIIYHGVNTKEFHPLEPEERASFREKFYQGRVHPETFVVVVVARNQMRKDLPRTMQIFKEFQKRRPDSFLYIHAQNNDAWGTLSEYARQFNLEIGKDWGYPTNFNANIGVNIESVNKVYNSADCILSTSLGEGFGFYNIEGFATRVPVVAPNNTTHPELFGYQKNEDISDMDKLWEKVRGVPIKCRSTTSEWATYGPTDFERIRPLVNVDDAVKKLIWLYDNPDKAKAIAERAYNWIQDYSWDKVSAKWDELFTKIHTQLKEERAKVIAERAGNVTPVEGQSDNGQLITPTSA